MNDERYMYTVIGSREHIDFEDINHGFYFYLEDVQTFIYYVHLLDPIQAERFYKAVTSKLVYSSDQLEEVGDYTQENKLNQMLPITELPILLNFINTEVLPSLQVYIDNGIDEPLLSIWGIEDSMLFNETLKAAGGIFTHMFELYCDNLTLAPVDFLKVFTIFRDFFQEVVNDNIDYKIFEGK